MLLILLLGWIVFNIWLASRIARLARHGLLKVLTFILLVLLFNALPLADEIIGKFQFDQLCKEAEDVHIFGSVPVGKDFYFPDGRWKLSDPSLPFNEVRRLADQYENLARYENKSLEPPSLIIPVSVIETKIYSRRNNELLASYKTYGTKGGWLSRNFEKPIIVRDICWPPAVDRDMKQRILTLDKFSIGEKQ